jgi:hypothetical protein
MCAPNREAKFCSVSGSDFRGADGALTLPLLFQPAFYRRFLLFSARIAFLVLVFGALPGMGGGGMPFKPLAPTRWMPDSIAT